MSHSWGSVMGFDIANTHPELLYASIPISPVVDANKSSVLTVNLLKNWALKNNNNQAFQELEKIQIPYIEKNDFFFSTKMIIYI